MKREPQKTYTCNMFGFEIKIITNDQNTTAIVEDSGCTFTGTAVLHAPDIYDHQIGKNIAVRAALTKLHSYGAGQCAKLISGFQSDMRHHNQALREVIDTKRWEQKYDYKILSKEQGG